MSKCMYPNCRNTAGAEGVCGSHLRGITGMQAAGNDLRRLDNTVLNRADPEQHPALRSSLGKQPQPVAKVVVSKTIEEIRERLPKPPAPPKFDPEAAPLVDFTQVVARPCATASCDNHPIIGGQIIENKEAKDYCLICLHRLKSERVLAMTDEQLRQAARMGGGWIKPSVLEAERRARDNKAAIEAGKPEERVCAYQRCKRGEGGEPARLGSNPDARYCCQPCQKMAWQVRHRAELRDKAKRNEPRIPASDPRARKTQLQRERRKKQRLLESQAAIAAITTRKDTHPAVMADMVMEQVNKEKRDRRRERKWKRS